ncbi:MAG TPA: EVE domain-containing protein [Gemmatimonadales bacterium]
MTRWLLKTEPSTYSWADLVRAGRATWDGVRNPAALGHLRGMQPGDEAFIYHTGGEKAVVGVARVVTAAYPDPKAGDPRLVVVDLEPVRPLASPVTLAAVKADARFAGFALVRVPRLSVMPVSPEQWRLILAMSRES